jgi:hypothetical protein
MAVQGMNPGYHGPRSLAVIAGLALIFLVVEARALDATEIMRKALDVVYYQGNDQRAEVDMTITDAQGRERVRQMTLLRRNEGASGGAQNYYVYFSKPADVKRMVFMAWKHPDQGDDRWLYLPALDLVRRIAASDERTSFVGSHFYYEDVSGRNLAEDRHTLESETDEYYVVHSMPVEPDSVEFSSYRVWVDKQTHMPMKLEYRDAKDRAYRTYRVLRTETVSGYPTAVEVQMEDKLSGGRTVLNYTSVEYSLGLPENIFTERYLRKPAKKYLR